MRGTDESMTLLNSQSGIHKILYRVPGLLKSTYLYIRKCASNLFQYVFLSRYISVKKIWKFIDVSKLIFSRKKIRQISSVRGSILVAQFDERFHFYRFMRYHRVCRGSGICGNEEQFKWHGYNPASGGSWLERKAGLIKCLFSWA